MIICGHKKGQKCEFTAMHLQKPTEIPKKFFRKSTKKYRKSTENLQKVSKVSKFETKFPDRPCRQCSSDFNANL
jgi:hypothetical protein